MPRIGPRAMNPCSVGDGINNDGALLKKIHAGQKFSRLVSG
jgi:hypothetical protein